MTKLVHHLKSSGLWAYLDLTFAEDHIDRGAEPSQIVGKIPTPEELDRQLIPASTAALVTFTRGM